MNVSRLGTRFVARWEGFRPCPYKVGNDPWTIGYGETQGVGPNTPCVSRSQARRDLRERLNRDYLDPIRELAELWDRARWHFITQREIDGLASFAYNLGPGPLRDGKTSTLARRLRSPEAGTFKGRKQIYREELPKWRSPGTQFEAGLLKRRNAEVALICRGNYLGGP